jgi:hypothetical protein
MTANAESQRAPELLRAHTPLTTETSNIISNFLKTPEPTCRICGGAPLIWSCSPCSKECLDKMLCVNDDTPFAFLPRERLPDKSLANR